MVLRDEFLYLKGMGVGGVAASGVCILDQVPSDPWDFPPEVWTRLDNMGFRADPYLFVPFTFKRQNFWLLYSEIT